MVRKKNKLFVDSADRTPHYSLRKLSVGVASVLLSTTLWMGANGSVAHAATDPSETNTASAAAQADTSQKAASEAKQADASQADASQAEASQAEQGQNQNAGNASDAAQATAEGQTAEAKKQTVSDVNEAESQDQKNDAAEGYYKSEPLTDVVNRTITYKTTDGTTPPASKSDSLEFHGTKITGDLSSLINRAGQDDLTVNKGDAKEYSTKEEALADLGKQASEIQSAITKYETEKVAYDAAKKVYNEDLAKWNASQKNPHTVTGISQALTFKGEKDADLKVSTSDQSPVNYINSKSWIGTDGNGVYSYYNVNKSFGDSDISFDQTGTEGTMIDKKGWGRTYTGVRMKTGQTIIAQYTGLKNSDYIDNTGAAHKLSKVKISYTLNSTTANDGTANVFLSNNPNITFWYSAAAGKRDDRVDFTLGLTFFDQDGNEITLGKGDNAWLDMSSLNNSGDAIEYFNPSGNTTKPIPGSTVGGHDDGSWYSNTYNEAYGMKWDTPSSSDRYIGAAIMELGSNSFHVGKRMVRGDRAVYCWNAIDTSLATPYKPFEPVEPTKPTLSWHEVTATVWDGPKDFTDVYSPEVKGYTPDQKFVSDKGITHDAQNINVVVTYTANSAKALVRFIDNTENRTLDNLELPGKTGETIDFAKANAQLNSYLAHGYKLVDNGIPTTETKFDTSDDTKGPSQVFVVKLDHDTVTVTPENPVNPGDKINKNVPDSPTYTPDQATVTEDHTLTVHYVGAPKNPADNLQKSHWTREVTIDKVTGETISSTDWATKDSYVKVGTPEIAGYTPDKSVVDEPTLRTNQEVTVTYTANSAKALVRFIDNTENRTLDNLELPGKTGETIDFAKANAQLNSYLAHGYKLVDNGIPTTETKFDTSDDTKGPSQVFVVRLDHTMTPGETTTTGKQTVTYVYKDKDGKVVKTKTVEQDTTFTGKTTKDEVTGKTTTTWDQKDHKYTAVTTPVEPGYTADKQSVGGETVTLDDPNRSYTVVYTSNGSVVPVDSNGNPIPNTPSVPYETDPKDPTKVVDGKVPEVPSWTPKNGKPGDPVTPKDPTKDTAVPYDHTMTPGETTVSGKQTVTYVYKDKDGKVVKTKTVEQDTTFTGKTTKDEVTGKTTTTWDQKDHKYTAVTTPVVKGYTADKKSVGGETVTPDNPNRSYTVVYTPNGSIVPVDPNGNPIPGINPVPYETDPNDPTKVVDGKVPEVPSWTPKNGKPGDPVVPTDPSKDTKVPYDHTITPGKTTTTGKVEGLPEKPAKSAKAPAKKLVKTTVKAPKAVKTAEPAKTISIKESAQAQDQLPQTGEDNSKAAFGLGLASILGGIGILGAFKRKKKEN